VIFIYKQGKDKKSAFSYRPISLLPCIGKLMEKVLGSRVRDYIEKKALLSPSQYGFRQHISSIDALLTATDYMLEHSFPEKKGETKKHPPKYPTLMASLDFSKAYDRVWSEGLIWKLLNQYKIKGEMACWLADFIENRTARARYLHVYSEDKNLLTGLPQGSVLAPLLFILFINDLLTQLPKDTVVAFADDCNLIIREKTQKACTRQMNRSLKIAHDWAAKWRMLFNEQKTQLKIFTGKNEKNIDRTNKGGNRVTFGGKTIKLQSKDETLKMLGVYFDQKLNFRKHHQILAARARKKLSRIKHTTSAFHGMGLDLRKMIVEMVILPTALYAAAVTAIAPNSSLKPLESLQYAAARWALESPPGVAQIALEAELHWMPIRQAMSWKEGIQFLRLLTSPMRTSSEPWIETRRSWDQETRSPKQWPARAKTLLTEMHKHGFCRKIPEFCQILSPTELNAEWEKTPPRIIVHVPKLTPPTKREMVRDPKPWAAHYETEIRSQKATTIIYTDGSELESGAAGYGLAIHSHNRPPELLPYPKGTASNNEMEIEAIATALKLITARALKNTLIVTDSQIALKAASKPIKNGPIAKCAIALQNALRDMDAALTPIIMWVPSHLGIEGNENADKTALKAAKTSQRNLSRTPLPKPLTKLAGKKHLKSILSVKVQNNWESAANGRHLHCIMPLRIKPRRSTLPRWKQRVLNRLRLGSAALNVHLSKIGVHHTEMCESCDEPETVEHYLLHCSKYSAHRQKMLQNLQKIHWEANLGTRRPTLRILLNNRKKPKSVSELIIKNTLQYVEETERLMTFIPPTLNELKVEKLRKILKPTLSTPTDYVYLPKTPPKKRKSPSTWQHIVQKRKRHSYSTTNLPPMPLLPLKRRAETPPIYTTKKDENLPLNLHLPPKIDAKKGTLPHPRLLKKPPPAKPPEITTTQRLTGI